MPVYLLAAGESGFVKIGHAANVRRRIAQLQGMHHELLRLLRTWPGGEAEEAALHQAFSEFHHRGEWFRFCPAMLDADPANLVPVVPTEAEPEWMAHLHRARALFGGTQGALAKAAGRSQQAIHKAHSRGVSADLARRIEQATAGKVTAKQLCSGIWEPDAETVQQARAAEAQPAQAAA